MVCARVATFLHSVCSESSHPETGGKWRCDGEYLKYDELCAALLSNTRQLLNKPLRQWSTPPSPSLDSNTHTHTHGPSHLHMNGPLTFRAMSTLWCSCHDQINPLFSPPQHTLLLPTGASSRCKCVEVVGGGWCSHGQKTTWRRTVENGHRK